MTTAELIKLLEAQTNMLVVECRVVLANGTTITITKEKKDE